MDEVHLSIILWKTMDRFDSVGSSLLGTQGLTIKEVNIDVKES